MSTVNNQELPLVSVCLITYNHEKYIAHAIESALMQRTFFKYEIVIGEDCSTDNTRAIVRYYADRYPERIFMLLPKQNLGAHINFITTLNACKGKYIAILEGDDYWTDPYKLQTQISFLEENPDFNVCYHRVDSEADLLNQSGIGNHVFFFADSLKGKNGATLSMVFRNSRELQELYEKTALKLPMGDWPLECLLTLNGKGYFIDRSMGFYSQLSTGVSVTKLQRKESYFESRIIFFESLLKYVSLSPDQHTLIHYILIFHKIANQNSKLNKSFTIWSFLTQVVNFVRYWSFYKYDPDYQYSYKKQLHKTFRIINSRFIT